MFGIGANFKMVYFNRSVIKTNWKRINESPMKKAGLLVRKIARNSIRRRRFGLTSAPGTPPYSHKPGVTPPFKMIYSVPNWTATSVVVGMVGFGTVPPVPGLHEHGGYARRQVITHRAWKTIKGRKRLILKRAPRIVKYPPRPFMRPALRIAMASLPMFWRNSISARAA